ncbi:MAG TPA: nucleotide-binding protein [Methanocorpusculum sp.]|nr:nucleotide-binding protein [Methanocorpusculum sp.]HJK01941.1 nucleotide-binding protein [Methanocorpusculum sp.]
MASDRYGCSDRVMVILDTNALMMPVQFGVDLFEELCELFGGYDALVPAEVICELRGLAQGHGINATAARFGLKIATRCMVLPPYKDDISVDDKVIISAGMFNAVVVTNDKQLKNRLLSLRIPVVVLRSRSRLELIG